MDIKTATDAQLKIERDLIAPLWTVKRAEWAMFRLMDIDAEIARRAA